MRKPTALMWMSILVILLSAFFMRIHRIIEIPPGYAYDAASNIADALRIAKGIPYPLYFDARPEPLYRFVLGAWFALVSPSFFTGFVLQAFIGLSGVALAYRAGLDMLRTAAYRHIGAIVVSGALAAAMAHLFLSRATYRASLLIPVILFAWILLLRAARSPHKRTWAFAGASAVFGVHTYLAGIMVLPWAAVFWLHQSFITPQPRPPWRLRGIFMMSAGMVLVPWVLLVVFVPNLFSRVADASALIANKSPLERLITGIPVMLAALMVGNDRVMLFNLPNTPPLNAFLTCLALIGLATALWRWRKIEMGLLLTGLGVFTLPALLSNDPNSSIRLIGTVPFLCLLAGLGGITLLNRIKPLWMKVGWLRDNDTLFVMGSAFFIAVTSMLATHTAYQTFFDTRANYEPPESEAMIPASYTLAYVAALNYLTRVTEPTYVPLPAVNTELAYFVLQHAAYTTVTTWARYGLRELPAGQIFYPEHGYFHLVFTPQESLQVLLLPQEKTIVILPPMLIQRPQGVDIPLLRHPKFDWVIGRIAPRPAEPMPERTLPDLIPTFGNGLDLVTPPQNLTLVPGSSITQVVEWRVTAQQPADVVSVLQLMDTNYNAIASHEQRILPHLYPSPLWQPGDIIPDSHALTLPERIPDTLYRLAAGVYIIPYQARQLPIKNPGSLNYLDNLWLWGVGRITAPLDASMPENIIPLAVTLDDTIQLVGYTLEKAALNWTLTLYWQPDTQPEQDWIVFVHALDAENKLITQRDEIPNGGQTPTWSWLPGQLIQTQHALQLPAEPATLNIGMYHPLTFERVPIMQNGDYLPDNVLTLWRKSDFE
jgi:hypothetical protein